MKKHLYLLKIQILHYGWKSICRLSYLSSIAFGILSNLETSAATRRSFTTQGCYYNKHKNKLLNPRKNKLKFVEQKYKIVQWWNNWIKIVNNSNINLEILNQIDYETDITEQIAKNEEINETECDEFVEKNTCRKKHFYVIGRKLIYFNIRF